MEATAQPKYTIRFQRHSIMGTAEDFYCAGTLCLNKYVNSFDSHYLFPVLINYAFSGEIYFKAIYLFETKKKNKKIHSYNELYDQLSMQARQQIEQLYTSNCKNECFGDALKRYSDVFSKWRYKYEVLDADTDVDDFLALINAIKTTCEQIENSCT